MKAYKLIRKMKDGSLSPLFINKKSRIPIGTWMDAELNPTKGFAVRKGWHCTLKPEAPHLSDKGRVWVEVEVDDFAIISPHYVDFLLVQILQSTSISTFFVDSECRPYRFGMVCLYICIL